MSGGCMVDEWMYGCMDVRLYICTHSMYVCMHLCRCVNVVDVCMEYGKLNNIGVYKST